MPDLIPHPTLLLHCSRSDLSRMTSTSTPIGVFEKGHPSSRDPIPELGGGNNWTYACHPDNVLLALVPTSSHGVTPLHRVFMSNLSGPYRAMRAAMRCERRCVLNMEMAMRCDAKILAMHILAAEILRDALPRCKNTSDAMPRCRPLSVQHPLKHLLQIVQCKIWAQLWTRRTTLVPPAPTVRTSGEGEKQTDKKITKGQQDDKKQRSSKKQQRQQQNQVVMHAPCADTS